jgi:hypothetical protein
MKRSAAALLLLAFIFIVKSDPAYADKPRVKGYYINVAGERQSVMIELPTKLLSNSKVDNMQRNFFTVFDKGGRKNKLTAEDASEFGFSYEGEDFVFRILPTKIQNVTHIQADFYKVLMEGPCMVYLTFVGQGSYYIEYCLYKNEDQFYITTTGFGNQFAMARGRVDTMEELFSDCPDLVQKLKTKEYKKGDDRWFRIVQYYNESCQSTEKNSGTEED